MRPVVYSVVSSTPSGQGVPTYIRCNTWYRLEGCVSFPLLPSLQTTATSRIFHTLRNTDRMNVAMGVYASAIIVVLLSGQVFSASLSAIVNNEQTQYQVTALPSTLDELEGQQTTTMQTANEYPLGSIAKQVHDHQEAIKWFKIYKYLPQEDDISCESCDPNRCAEDCLELLQQIVAEPLKEFQKFNEMEMTGVLTTEDLHQMNQPRCGDSDEKEGGGNSRRQKRGAMVESDVWSAHVWPAHLMPLTIKVHGGTDKFQVADIENIALECARLWAEPSSLQFQLASPDARKGNIDIRFEYIDGPLKTVGVGLSPVVWGDESSYLKLDNAEIWKRDAKTDGDGVSLKWAICHEMGHNLGLSHSNDHTALMYPSGVGQNEDRLAGDDFAGITKLYSGRNGKTVMARARPGPPSTKASNTARYQRPIATRRPVTRHPVTYRHPVTTRRPVTRRPTTRRPVWRPTSTRAPKPTATRFNSQNTQHHRPGNARNYTPRHHMPVYRPAPNP